MSSINTAQSFYVSKILICYLNPKLLAFPILALLLSVSVMSLNSVHAQTSDTTGTFTVDFGNGHSFDIPYSISGATVSNMKADTSIPELKIAINPTADGHITLKVPGGDRNSTSQQNLIVLVDGQKTDYTQTFENNSRMITVSFSAHNSSIEIIGQHTPQMVYSNSQPSTQPNSSCSQDDIKNAKQQLADTEKRYGDLKMKIYNDWQSAHNSGQYTGTWEEYAKEKFFSSPELADIKATHEKSSSILKNCFGNSMPQYNPQPYGVPNTSCSQDDVNHAKQELATSEKQASELKSKIYQEYQQAQSSGQFNGTWNDYAHEKFSNSPEIAQIKTTHDKFSSVLKNCYGQVPPHANAPSNPSYGQNIPTSTNDVNAVNPDNGGNLALDSQTGTQSTLQPSDLASNLPQNIPGWVRGIAGWWAEGKISDSEFVSAIKFLVHQGIIKL